jgi:hypothetical protein
LPTLFALFFFWLTSSLKSNFLALVEHRNN